MTATVRDFVADASPVWLTRYWGQRLMGTLGLLGDALLEGSAAAWLAPRLQRRESPDDALPFAGQERLMPAYPGESFSSHRSRLLDAWNTWSTSGAAAGIVAAAEAAGFVGAQVYRFNEWPLRNAAGGWSQFWVFLPAGSHPYAGAVPSTVESFWRGLIRTFKPATWVCPEVVVELDGWTIGTGHTIGEAGLTIGGTQTTITI